MFARFCALRQPGITKELCGGNMTHRLRAFSWARAPRRLVHRAPGAIAATIALMMGSCLISPKDYPLAPAVNEGGEGGGGDEGATSGSSGTANSSAGGTGGKANAGGSEAGGKTTGGATGKGGASSNAGTVGTGPNAGTGGSTTAKCASATDCDDDMACTRDACDAKGICHHTALPVPAKGAWVTTASHEALAIGCTDFQPQTANRATDGSVATRWSTGKAQTGDEWLQIDFGTTVALSYVELDGYDASEPCGGTDDYGRQVELRVSDAPNDMAAPVVATAFGVPDLTRIDFPEGATGRYLLISQTGTTTTSWWSLVEINASCR